MHALALLLLAALLGVSRQACPPLTSNSLIVACLLNATTTDCGRPQPVGTIASVECKPGFEIVEDSVPHSTCSDGGQWKPQIVNCTPDCGRRISNSGVPLVAGGSDPTFGEFPWHVGIYEKDEGELRYLCGGTLITPNIVISAATCFSNNATENVRPAQQFKVAGGKLLRAWEDPDKRVQRRDVERIQLRPLYSGRAGNYASNIAVVRVSAPFEIGPVVNVACVDWSNLLEDSQLVTGQNGVVAGWGFTQHQVLSDSLKYVSLPYVATEECLEAVPRQMRHLLTEENFCAGFVNRTTGLCRGDSGGGLVFLHKKTNKYYLRGVVSLAFDPPHDTKWCNAENVVGFTRVSQYLSWIKKNL